MRSPLALASTYDAYRDDFIRARARVLLWLTLALNPFWALLDLYVSSEAARELFLPRLAMELAVIPQLIALRATALRRWPELFIIAPLWNLGLNCNLMTDKLGGFPSEYYNGLNLVALCTSVMIPVRLRAHLFGQLVLIAHYVLVNLHHGLARHQLQALTLHLYFLVTIFVACDASVLLFSRFHRSQYAALRAVHDANERLLGLDRAKSQLFENVSHELRTPLTMVLAAFDTIERMTERTTEHALGPGPDGALVVGRRNASALLLLIEELLQIARFDAGVARLDAKPTDVAELVRASVAQFVDRSRGRSIVVSGASAPLLANVDRALMRKVVHNLVANAVKFTDPEHGHVQVALSSDGDEVFLSVEDDGIGVTPEQLPRVFERFSQGDREATRRFGGVGIGLSLVKEVVTKHGGDIALTSEPGKGSRFALRIPIGEVGHEALVEDEADAALMGLLASATKRPAADTSTAVGIAGGERVLIVEDHADLRAHLAVLLGSRYRVETASDGCEALERIRESAPDLIVSDVMMPRLDGDELLRLVRRDPTTARIPFVLLTAMATRGARVTALAEGADDYLNKPFDGEELLARVANLLAMRRQERELAALAKELDRANARLNLELEERIAELGRAGRLKDFFPARIAEQLMSASATRERQHVAVLAMELALESLSGDAASKDEGAVEEWIDAHHDLVARVLVDRGAIVERVGLDTIAYFCAPAFVSPPEQVAAALHAARDLLARVAPLARDHRRIVRAAITAGPAVIGVFGTDALRSFTAVGLPLTEARQTLAHTSGGKITLAPSARELLPVGLASPDDVPSTDSRDHWPIGATLAGKYRPEAWLGSGSTASVFRSRHLATGGEVAVKLLHARCGENDDAALRFERESRRAASLQSPYTVRVFDFGRDGNAFFLVMELLDGPTLAEVLGRGPLPIPRVLGIIEQTARALGEAHEAGLIHRDVKPSNVIVLEKGASSDFVKVVDFGLSRSTSTMTSAPQLAGTPSYIAPEVWRGGIAGPPADLYALGVVAYEMLAGRTPFSASDVARLGILHCYRPVPALPDTVPGMVRELVYWMLEKDPARRPASGAEVAESIEDLLAEAV